MTSIGRLVATLLALASLPGASALAADVQADGPVTKTLIVSFDPLRVQDPVGSLEAEVTMQAGTLFELLQRPIAARRLLYRAPTEVERRIAEIDPYAPEAMISKYVRLTYATGTNLDTIQAQLARDTRIRSVERLPVVSLSSPPLDVYFVSTATFPERQWGMQTRDASLNRGGLNFPAAWDALRGSAYVTVLDDGIETSDGFNGSVHPDLVANFRQQFSMNFANRLRFDAVDERFEPILAPNYGHGTHVAGIVAAASSLSQTTDAPNLNGVAGGCFNCALTVTKTGVNADPFNELVYTTDMGVQVINRSGGWGTQPTSCLQNRSICDALERARNRGVVFVASSGNNGNQGRGDDGIDFPANATKTDGSGVRLAIAVGGLQWDGNIWSPGYTEPGSNWGPQQALMAPAKDVVSTFYRAQSWNTICRDQLNSNTGGLTIAYGYGDCNGTSMSAPHVSALAALVKSGDPLLNTEEVRNILTSSGSLWPTQDIRLGFGIPDAGKSVQKALDAYGVSDPIPSSYKILNRLTPLFSLYSPKAKNHFYTTVPQMAAAALDGTLRPRPRAQAIIPGRNPPNSWSACCTQTGNPNVCSNLGQNGLCGGTPVPLPPGGITIYEPDGITKIGGVQVAIAEHPETPDAALGSHFGASQSSSSSYYGGVTSSLLPATLGQLSATNVNFSFGETPSTLLYAVPLDDAPLTYNVVDKDSPIDPNYPPVVRKVPEYNAFPAYLLCRDLQNPNTLTPCPNPYGASSVPTAAIRVYTSYKYPDPAGGPADLVPLYRMSFRCGDGPDPVCNSNDPNYNPYHVSHVYSTDQAEVFGSFKAAGYKLDGIEGYVFSKNYTPPAGTVKLCRSYNSTRDDWVLFPGAGVGGSECSATAFEGGTYNIYSGTYFGYVYSAISDTTQAGRAHANIQTGLFRNAPGVSQFILDFDFNGTADNYVAYGNVGDKGLVADMNNDGRADLIIYQRDQYGQGLWNVDTDRNGTADYVYKFGGDSADRPVVGKFHSATATQPDLAVYRNGIWYIAYAPLVAGPPLPANQTCAFGGLPQDVALVGDFNHDGIDDLVIYRDGYWFVHFMPGCTSGTADLTLAFGGVPSDVPLVADWDRDGIADLVILRNGIWYVTTRRDSYAQVYGYAFGAPGDIPLAARFNQ